MSLDSIATRLERILEFVSATMLAIVVVSVSWQIFGRYVLGKSPSWTEELCGMLFAWSSMLAAAAVLRSGQHLAISALLEWVPPGVRTVLLWIRDLCMLAAFVILGHASYEFSMLNAEQESPALEIPLTFHYAAVIVGSLFLALFLIVSRLTRKPIPLEAFQQDSAML